LPMAQANCGSVSLCKIYKPMSRTTRCTNAAAAFAAIPCAESALAFCCAEGLR
jgi:hypothetical protein